METNQIIISSGIRKVNNKSKLCINLTGPLIHLLLNEERYYSRIDRLDEYYFRLSFLKNNVPDSRKLVVKSSTKTSGSVMFKTEQVDLPNNITAKTTTIRAQLYPNFDLTFSFNPFNVEESIIRRIETAEDKENAGFNPNSDWGVAYIADAEKKKRERLITIAKQKFDMLYEEIKK